MKKGKILDVVLMCLKILLPILIAVPLVFFTYRLVENRISDLQHMGDVHYYSGIGLYIFLSHMVLFAANVILTVIGIIGFIMAKKHTSASAYRRNVMGFRCLALAPLLSQILYVLATLIVTNIG